MQATASASGTRSDPSATALSLRLVIAGLCAGLILATTSYLINVLWLGPAHDVLDVFRPDDDLLLVPGLAISALVWGGLLATGYRVFWRPPVGGTGWIEGAKYGVLVCLFFTVIQSVFLFQFIRISPILLLGDVLHYLIASTLAGAAIGTLVPHATR
jgi:hypothetical protein